MLAHAELPGVGKTTRANEPAAAHRILRLTPDEWMAPLFGDSEAGGRRDILEGRMVWVAHEVLRSGSSVASIASPRSLECTCSGCTRTCHADLRTTMRCDHARKNLDRHPNDILAASTATGISRPTRSQEMRPELPLV